MAESKRGVVREVAVGVATTLIVAAITAIVSWLSPRAQAFLVGPSGLRAWEVYAIFAAGLLLGAAPGLWIGYRKGSTNPVAPIRGSASQRNGEGRSASSPALYPRPLHDSCIRALRFKDNAYQSVNDIAAHLAEIGGASPKSDIEQALAELVEHEWVSDRINVQTGWEYKLIGGGVAYARECRYPVEGHPGGTRSTNRPRSLPRQLK